MESERGSQTLGWLIIAHRGLARVVGPVVMLWCLSGLVMIAVPFPQLHEIDRRAGLDPIDFSRCCSGGVAWPRSIEEATQAVVESVAGVAIVRALVPETTEGRERIEIFDLDNERIVNAWSNDALIAVAQTHLRNSGRVEPSLGLAALDALEPTDRAGDQPPIEESARVERDQWTVSGRLNPHRPLLRVRFGDPLGTTLYVSTATAEVVQRTTRTARRWNQVGAISHWLYWTNLREHPILWAQVVIWTSLAGLALVVAGLILGLSRLRFGGPPTLLSGTAAWHHLSGLLSGVLLLTWLASGLMSMNPWGLLSSSGADLERHRLRWFELRSEAKDASAESPTAQEGEGGENDLPLVSNGLRTVLAAVAGKPWPQPQISVRIAPFASQLAIMAYAEPAHAVRLDALARPAPLRRSDLEVGASRMRPSGEPAEMVLLETPDAYHYSSHQSRVPLPVVRVIWNDEERTRYYLDPESGDLLAKFDRNARLYRWLHQALHSLDWSAAMRQRPLWDGLLWLLVGLALAPVVTGLVLGYRGRFRNRS